jgi:hypothetical protein
MNDIHLVPVIQPGSFKVSIVHPEAKGMNEMKFQLGRTAEPGYISGIGRDFRLVKRDLKPWFFNTPMCGLR